MMDDIAWSPPRRRNGIWWIVASGLLLPAGWIAWLLVALAGYDGAGNSTHSLAFCRSLSISGPVWQPRL
ncbi:hypothetical protein DEI83_14920 [Curtobacterium sp. MCBD17_021]|nr:hypothetical protein DEI83_14920 [Curtobacterium sp. MCBD17_021]